MKSLIEKAFPQILENLCLQVRTDEEFAIYDSEDGRCLIREVAEGITHFTVKNPSLKEIGFLAIDKCVFMDSDLTERCDCAVFDNKTFCFIEIKETNRRRPENSRKAREQLLTTIATFKNKIDFSDKRLEAYVVVGIDFTKTFPAAKSIDLATTYKFEQVGVTLYQSGNEKKFK